jgi:putative hydrolase of the HAD superfamily
LVRSSGISHARYSAGEISFRDQRRERLREVLDPTLADEAANRIFARFSDAYEANWTLFKDAVPCLDALSLHRIGLITNGQGQLQRRKLVTTRIADRFDCVLISEECGYSKPDERIFLLACELAGEAPKNAVYVGDRYDLDALAAREAGFTAYGSTEKPKPQPNMSRPLLHLWLN